MAIKVSQATIDKIKEMGMTKALKSAGKASPEMREGLKRMYGARRFNAAVSSTKPYNVQPQRTADSARAAATSKPTYKSADAARSAMPGKGPAARVSAAKPKTNTTSNPMTALHNKLSPMGNKSQKYVSGLPKEGLAGRKSVPGKPSIGEQISGAFSGKGIGNKSTASSVASTMAKRMGISVAEYNKRLAAAQKAKKSK